MEVKIIEYLKRILKTIFIGLLWMAVNTKIGIMNNYAFYENKIQTGNILFYIFFIVTLVLLLIFFYKLWNKDINFNEDDVEQNNQSTN